MADQPTAQLPQNLMLVGVGGKMVARI